MIKYENAQIVECGLRYFGHFNFSNFYVCGDNWSVEIPLNDIGKFAKIFPEINWEDGEFLHVLSGKYIRLGYDENLKICSMNHIVRDLEYAIK